MNFKTLNIQLVTELLKNYNAKYLSQHDITRHYIIEYDTESFTNTTYENNIPIGVSNGTYKLLENEKGQCLMNIKYETIFESPNIDSPFNKKNSFYSSLNNYTIGPFYVTHYNFNINNEPKSETHWYPVLYNHLLFNDKYKVLNFYDKSSTCEK